VHTLNKLNKKGTVFLFGITGDYLNIFSWVFVIAS